MGKSEQLQWETRNGRIAAGFAILAPILLIVGFVLQQRALSGINGDQTDVFLNQLHAHPGKFFLGTIVSALGGILTIPVLVFLYRAIKFRRPQIPSAALILAIAGPVAAGIVAIAEQIAFLNAANTFAAHPHAGEALTAAQQHSLSKATTPDAYLSAVKRLGRTGHADDLLHTSTIQIVAGIGEAANLALAAAFLFIGLNGMRSGVFSKFMGILGVIIGVLYVIPLFGSPAILEFFWLVAVALILLDRWPQGRGPAWDSGEPIPWPTAQDRRDELDAKREGREPPARRPAVAARSNGSGSGDGSETAAAGAHATATAQHPRSKKRKKKRRG